MESYSCFQEFLRAAFRFLLPVKWRFNIDKVAIRYNQDLLEIILCIQNKFVMKIYVPRKVLFSKLEFLSHILRAWP